jgi:hypothetical protein
VGFLVEFCNALAPVLEGKKLEGKKAKKQKLYKKIKLVKIFV